jgi:hypothetical protein
MSIPTGNAQRLTTLTPPRASTSITNGATNTVVDPNKTQANGGINVKIVPNPLEIFASYTSLWTMAVLSKEQYNDPSLYRGNPSALLNNIIFSAGGRFDSQRVSTKFGTPEYFINNFVMQSVITSTPRTGNSNAVRFTFDIYEPFSMGLLLQSLQIAAINNKYANYLDNTPYVLRLDFKGYDESGRIISSIKPKFFVFKLTSVKFTVSESGSVYKVEAIPFNHQAFADAINITFTDLKISGETVEEALAGTKNGASVAPEKNRSLMKMLNDNEERLKKEKIIGEADVYEIQFPKKFWIFKRDSGSQSEASADANDIASASFGFDIGSGGNVNFRRHGDAEDTSTGRIIRDKLTIDIKSREFQFAQSQTITDIITQMVVSSDYAVKALDPKNQKDGFIKWFKIDIQVQLLDFDPVVGDFAKKFIFRVVPYLFHSSTYSNTGSPPAGLPKIEKNIAKKYEYIYTGQNVDILKFDITINNLFYTGTNPNPATDSGKGSNINQKGGAENTPNQTRNPAGADPKAQVVSNLGRSRTRKDPNLIKMMSGGSGSKETEQFVAESFHNAFISGSSADMVTVDLEILGDTYWLLESGMSNHFVESGESEFILEDGTANYEGTEVYIYITFRTPIDVSETTGLYEFASAGKESSFSGIYRITTCESTFSDGVFKQKLKCLRIPIQPADLLQKGLRINPSESPPTVIEGASPPKTQIASNGAAQGAA